MTIAAVRAGIVAKLATVDDIGGRVHSFAPDSISPPSAFVGTMTYNPVATFDEPNLTVQVWVVVSRAASSSRAAETIDAYIDGATAVPDVLEASPTAWDSLAVSSVEFPITVEIGTAQYLAARFDCEVFL